MEYLVVSAVLGAGIGYLVAGPLGLVVGLVLGPAVLVLAFVAVVAMVYG